MNSAGRYEKIKKDLNSAIVLGKCETYLGYREQCGLNCVDEFFFLM